MADSYVIRQGTERNTNPMFMEIMAKDLTELATYASKCTPGSLGYLEDATVYRLGTQGTWVKVGEDVPSRLNTLTSQLADTVKKSGVGEVVPLNTTFMDLIPAKNRFNVNDPDVLLGKYLNADGTTTSNASYNVTGFIPVTPGEILAFSYKPAGNQAIANMRSIVAYDSAKTVISGNTSGQTSYTVPDGAAFVRAGWNIPSYQTNIQIEASASGFTAYELWRTPDGTIKTDSLPQIPPESTSFFEAVPAKNRFNLLDADLLTGKFIPANGAPSINESYIATGYIPVTPGEIIRSSYTPSGVYSAQAAMTMAYIAAYNSWRVIQPALGTNTSSSSYTVPAGVAYIRVSYHAATYGTYVQLEAHDRGFTPFELWHEPAYQIKDENATIDVPLHCFLPREVYVAVGRTIELYNNQVCLEADKYHLQWSGAIGRGLERKYTITGTSEMLSAHSVGLPNGQYQIRLNLYDDNQTLVWSSFTIVKVVANTPATKKILPIGDSLTNWKAWLQEVMLLSANEITFAGTRYSGLSIDSLNNNYPSGTILHEGRSGWSAADYLANAAYTFDDRYSGASGVAGTVNPFWDGDSFSLNHYLTAQAGHIGGTPDAIQIFLGTNGMAADPTANAADIMALIDIIQAEYPAMPIFVVNTIYRSTQNGYANAGAWRYSEDSKVFDLMVRLDSLLNGYTGVTVIPMAVCHDTQYNFGAVDTPVNPRAAQTESLPVEAVHPTNQGYFQMADLLFSTYCGVLGTV